MGKNETRDAREHELNQSRKNARFLLAPPNRPCLAGPKDFPPGLCGCWQSEHGMEWSWGLRGWFTGHQDDNIMMGLHWLQLHQCGETVLGCDAAAPPPWQAALSSYCELSGSAFSLALHQRHTYIHTYRHICAYVCVWNVLLTMFLFQY